jgi:hypothetical protein
MAHERIQLLRTIQRNRHDARICRDLDVIVHGQKMGNAELGMGNWGMGSAEFETRNGAGHVNKFHSTSHSPFPISIISL